MSNWDKFFFEETEVSKWIQMVTNTALMVALLATIVVVCCVRQRTDCFIIVALSCYTISISMQAAYWIMSVSTDMVLTTDWETYLFLLEKPFYLTAHWAFSA